MARPFSVVPYHDPSSSDHIMFNPDVSMLDDECPGLEMPGLLPPPPTDAVPVSASLTAIKSYLLDEELDIDAGDEVDDSSSLDLMIFNMLNDDNDCSTVVVAGNPTAGPSGSGGGSSGGLHHSSGTGGSSHHQVPGPSSSGFGNPQRIPVWPVPPSPYNCSCCQNLREIIHINGSHQLNLEVHGRLGMISHAVLKKFDVEPSAHGHEYYMYEESIASVKQFLVQYCQDRKQEGYIMLQDPLSVFYDAVCVGLNSDDFLRADGPPQQSPERNSDGCQMNTESESQQAQESNEASHSKSALAAQRERAGKLKLKDLTDYFDLPIEEAAKRMNLCPTVMKKICRRHGLTRWPYRKIRSIHRKIAERREWLNASIDLEEKTRVEDEIMELEQQLRNISSPPLIIN